MTFTQLEAFPIPLSSLGDQRRPVSVLAGYDCHLGLETGQRKVLSEVKSCLMQHLLAVKVRGKVSKPKEPER